MKMREMREDAYFAAANSASGFYSFFPQCFDAARVKHVYAIKGGPGTGKSRFMRDVADHAERCGRGVEYIYCSSDPNSLDGVILSSEAGCIAILDATAPHVYEPKLPGVREELIDLGVFWDPEKLEAHRREIVALNAEKSSAYRQAYRYLAAVGDCIRTRDELLAPYVRKSAVERYAERLMSKLADGEEYITRPSLIYSVGMYGEVCLDTYLKMARQVYLIDDCHGCAQYFLKALGELAEKKRLETRVSYDPILPDRIDGLFFVRDRIAVVLSKGLEEPEGCRHIGMRRFVKTASMKPIRREVFFAERMRRMMLDGAIERMEKVKTLHFQLEEIYIAAMDFEKKEAFTKRFCERLKL